VIQHKITSANAADTDSHSFYLGSGWSSDRRSHILTKALLSIWSKAGTSKCLSYYIHQ